MEEFAHRRAREVVRTGGTEEVGEGMGGVAISENKLNHESRYISNSQVNLNAEPNVEDFRNEFAELKTQVQTLRDELAYIKRGDEKRACDSSGVATKAFLQHGDQAIPANLGQSGAQATAESEHPIDGYARAEYRVRFKSSTGSIKYEAIENPLLGQPGKSLTSEKWLVATENANSKKESGLSTNEWTITIADRDLIACLMEALKDYINHTGRKAWETSQITLKSAFNPLVLNWRRIMELYNSMSDSPHREGTLFSRLNFLMEHVRFIYPSMIRIQESWENSRDIKWKDIEILFVPGSLIVANWTQVGSREVQKAPQVLKVDHIISHKEKSFFCITAWLWDWSGKDLTRTMYELAIQSYQESMRINDLPFYPIEFFMNEAGQQGIDAIRLSEQYRSRKDLFLKYTFGQKEAQAPLRYAGDVLARQIIDAPLYRSIFDFKSNEKEVAVQRLIEIDEEIVLDAQNYVRKGGGQCSLGSHVPKINSKICTCSLCEDIETKEWTRAMRAGEQAKPSINDLLLAPRVFGYALTRKMWCQFALNKIETVIIAEDEGFGKELILPEEIHRDENDDIKHMVKYHMNVMSKPTGERIGDTIGGKGESLILLFHGHSGTGKTLYAESLARWSGKALLKVGTSDIGQDLAKAETKLKEIFELAEAWNVVLLIDEADVLLDARGGSNEGALTKNTLVSVLLQEVEYFKGVLIMTTNRVMAFDPAILSRIHHAVNFTALTPSLQNAVWKLWLDRLVEKKLCIAKEKIIAWVEGLGKKGKNAGYPLNGREIRNIFILAQTLAFREKGESRITLDHIDRAYHYKVDFRQDTESQRQAGVMLLAHKLGPGNSG